MSKLTNAQAKLIAEARGTATKARDPRGRAVLESQVRDLLSSSKYGIDYTLEDGDKVVMKITDSQSLQKLIDAHINLMLTFKEIGPLEIDEDTVSFKLGPMRAWNGRPDKKDPNVEPDAGSYGELNGTSGARTESSLRNRARRESNSRTPNQPSEYVDTRRWSIARDQALAAALSKYQEGPDYLHRFNGIEISYSIWDTDIDEIVNGARGRALDQEDEPSDDVSESGADHDWEYGKYSHLVGKQVDTPSGKVTVKTVLEPFAFGPWQAVDTDGRHWNIMKSGSLVRSPKSQRHRGDPDDMDECGVTEFKSNDRVKIGAKSYKVIDSKPDYVKVQDDDTGDAKWVPRSRVKAEASSTTGFVRSDKYFNGAPTLWSTTADIAIVAPYGEFEYWSVYVGDDNSPEGDVEHSSFILALQAAKKMGYEFNPVGVKAMQKVAGSRVKAEAGVLGQGMSPTAKTADVDQSDREFIQQRQHRKICQGILGALGTGHKDVKELEGILHDFGVDADEINTVSDLCAKLDPSDAVEISDWMKQNKMPTHTESAETLKVKSSGTKVQVLKRSTVRGVEYVTVKFLSGPRKGKSETFMSSELEECGTTERNFNNQDTWTEYCKSKGATKFYQAPGKLIATDDSGTKVGVFSTDGKLGYAESSYDIGQVVTVDSPGDLMHGKKVTILGSPGSDVYKVTYTTPGGVQTYTYLGSELKSASTTESAVEKVEYSSYEEWTDAAQRQGLMYDAEAKDYNCALSPISGECWGEWDGKKGWMYGPELTTESDDSEWTPPCPNLQLIGTKTDPSRGVDFWHYECTECGAKGRSDWSPRGRTFSLYRGQSPDICVLGNDLSYGRRS